MKKTAKQQKNRKLMNHYSAWKYVVLITTVIILTLSAIPTWFGEQPSIQLTFSNQNSSEMSVVQLNQLLKTNHISADKIIEKDGKTTIVFDDENAQSKARALLNNELNKRAWNDTLTRFALRPSAVDLKRYDDYAEFMYSQNIIETLPKAKDYVPNFQ